MTVNASKAAVLGSASGSTQVHTNRQTKLGEEGREGGGGGGRNARSEVRVQEVGGGGGTGWVCD